MKFFTEWGFSSASWQGQRGEYWVLAQAVLILGFAILPVYRPSGISATPPGLYAAWAIATLLGLEALMLIAKGLLDLGANLTPLPHPKDGGQLVQTGIYGLVRHPLYGGLILAALGWAIYQISVTHLAGAIAGFMFFNAKADLEESWLTQKFSDYTDYQQRVKKLIPWLY